MNELSHKNEVEKGKEKVTNKVEPKEDLTNSLFYGIFYIMQFAFIISIISAFVVKDSRLRGIFLMESVVTGVSSFMYYLFIQNINKGVVNFQNVSRLRYRGWSITTPIMLIVLTIVLGMNTKTTVTNSMLLKIVGLDYVMLALGYLGEINMLDRITAMILGFLPFFAIFYILYYAFIKGKHNTFNALLYWVYFIIWSIYGIAYIFDERIKNVITNILDCIAKAFVALGIAYKYIL